MSSRIPDLVQHMKLDTLFVESYIVHQYDDSDDDGYMRSIRRSEHWEWSRLLARGGCGEVWLQKCVQGKRTYEWRAVKVILKTSPTAKQIEYMSELKAIANFFQSRVTLWSRTPLHCQAEDEGWANRTVLKVFEMLCETPWVVR